MFVEAAFAAGRVRDLSAEEAYRAGYVDRADRRELFPWNANVEPALSASPPEALALFEKLFEKYRGKYDLRIADPSRE
jgi:enoyl-CoA hydratase/carnithine racemase